MVDTRHPLCKDEQCTRQPSFGMEVRSEQYQQYEVKRGRTIGASQVYIGLSDVPSLPHEESYALQSALYISPHFCTSTLNTTTTSITTVVSSPEFAILARNGQYRLKSASHRVSQSKIMLRIGSRLQRTTPILFLTLSGGSARVVLRETSESGNGQRDVSPLRAGRVHSPSQLWV